MENEFVPVPGYPRSRIASDGRVEAFSPRYHKVGWRPLKWKVQNMGYAIVSLVHDTGRTWALVHRLVALTFLPNPLGLPVVNHKDGNPLNNTVSNLEWCTQSHNATHKHRALRKASGDRHYAAKFTAAAVRDIRRRIQAGETQTALARETGVSQPTISDMVTGRSWATA
jgi:hypothetical protein